MPEQDHQIKRLITHTNPLESEAEQSLMHTLNFRIYDARTTHHTQPHTTGWRQLPFMVFSYAISSGFDCLLENGHQYHLSKGQAYLLPAGLRHRLDCYAARGIRSTWMHATFTVYEGIDVFSLVDLPIVLPHTVAQRAMEACRKLVNLYDPSHRTPLPLQMIAQRKSAAFAFLEAIVSIAKPRDDYHHVLEATQRIGPALLAIQNEFATDLTHQQLAKRVPLSPSRFHEIFRKATGLSPIQYLLRRRLSAAQSMLIQNNSTLASIAEQCGFADAFHFSRSFKQYFGESPKTFRENRRQNQVKI